jgi:heme oxygenase
MSLKDITKDRHAAAEGTAFMKAVFDKTLPFALWVDFTYQKQLWYKEIEHAARKAGLLNALPGIERAGLIMDDYYAMDKPTGSFNTYKQETKDYASYIRSLDDPKRVMAHLYTWHMGDLFGGQMIKKIVDAPHTHLDFEDSKMLMTNMRSLLSDDMGDEANIAFDWAIKIMESYDSSLGQN